MKAKKFFSMITVLAVLALGLTGCTKEVTVVTLDKNHLEVTHGETFVLNATVLPNDAVDLSVEWDVDSDSNAVSATTSENTLRKEFLAENVGEAEVTVFSSNGIEAFCNVTVVENEEDKAARKKKAEEARIAAEKKSGRREN